MVAEEDDDRAGIGMRGRNSWGGTVVRSREASLPVPLGWGWGWGWGCDRNNGIQGFTVYIYMVNCRHHLYMFEKEKGLLECSSSVYAIICEVFVSYIIISIVRVQLNARIDYFFKYI